MAKEFLAYLLEQYQAQPQHDEGTPSVLSPLDALDTRLDTHAERMAAREGIKDFLECSRQCLAENPPQSHTFFANGFGLLLASGMALSLVGSAEDEEDGNGALEQAPSFAITEGRSMRGQSGIKASESFGITGNKTEPYNG